MNQWIRQIVIFAVFAAVFEALLPRSDMKKYIRLILGTFLILIVLEPILTPGWEVSLPDASTVPEQEMRPVLERVTEQYDLHIAEALKKSVEGTDVEVREVCCTLSADGILQGVTVVCGRTDDPWTFRLDGRGEDEERIAALREQFSQLLQTEVIVEWRS